ncbi:MAG: ACP S-malonyltransferase [Paraperlucidibaca sp.]|jgi:[acyl-carrier-protein] S-malonyltransferase|uniref:ACP S-malonyltransferase n=1 Tax=Paraperlucidibaca sp. TaxID=2708021 RepID=UPI001B79BF32|nr:ACP S-malonyltransferase [Paraperlucidibaca sp.]MBQ0722209.1 ACP S-malonyltransferase [Paraperlucidibaca sp.]MBQ0842014.1 ACP S-malonyltransferase [Paraperlucidibaca sp.]|tara:strand:+ start:220 stop:1155 length:936 start_codon:yes stop_codon:yes gene_type:complete
MTTTAWVFPGQGSQSIGMLADLAASYPIIEATFAEASAALGKDLWALAQNGPEAEMNATENTQPLLLAAGIAVWRAWKQAGGPAPDYLAGHSLGEYTALVAAEVISLADGVRLVAERGRLMQDAVPAGEGAMAAILGLDNEQVIAACKAAADGDVVAAVNFNAPGQVVIAGSAAAVDRAIIECKAAGAKRALPLSVSAPSHCALMRPAADELAKCFYALTFNKSVIPVVQNVSAKVASDTATLQAALVEQLYSPVRWVECVEHLSALGVTQMLESGPGKVLTGLNKRIDKNMTHWSLDSTEGMTAALESLC